MDNNDNQWTERFLRGLGLRISETAVKRIAQQVLNHGPLHPLYQVDGARVAGKATCQKVKKLVNAGRLDPLLQHWGLKQVADELEQQKRLQGAHLEALKRFLNGITFDTGLPRKVMRKSLQGLAQDETPMPIGAMEWESQPIASRVRSHLPGNPLWQYIEDWKTQQDEYRASVFAVAEGLRQGLREGLRSSGADSDVPPSEQSLLLDMFDWLAGQLLGYVPLSGALQCVHAPDGRGEAEKRCLKWGDAVYAEGSKDELERLQDVAQKMLKAWADSDDLRSIVRQYLSLGVLCERLEKTISQITVTELGKGTCADCPYPGTAVSQ